jgi:hypothetical protein
MKTPKIHPSGAAPDGVRHNDDEDQEGDIEHDISAFMEWCGLSGFPPAGIKGSDSDEVILRKWQAYKDSPEFDHTLFPPKSVLMVLPLFELGLNTEQIAEFNGGHLTKNGELVLLSDSLSKEGSKQ